MATTPTTASVSKQNDAIYDRQIRLWGADSQKKITSTNILYLNPSPLTCEILKNLLLAGISATLSTPNTLQKTAVQPMLFVDATMIGENIASCMLPNVQELNPLASVEADTRTISDCPDEWFGKFNIIVADVTTMSKSDLSRVNSLARKVSERSERAGSREMAADTMATSTTSTTKLTSLLLLLYYSTQCFCFIKNDCRTISLRSAKNGAKMYSCGDYGFNACCVVDLGAKHGYRPEVGKGQLGDEKFDTSFLPISDVLDAVKLSDCGGRFGGVDETFVGFKCMIEFGEKFGKGEWPTGVGGEEEVKNWLACVGEVLKEGGLKEGYLGNEGELGNIVKTSRCSLAVVCAVFGGVIGNEVIKAISGKGEPACNVLCFDGRKGAVKVLKAVKMNENGNGNKGKGEEPAKKRQKVEEEEIVMLD